MYRINQLFSYSQRSLSEWFDLEAYKQADYKARFFGIDMGFYDLKTF